MVRLMRLELIRLVSTAPSKQRVCLFHHNRMLFNFQMVRQRGLEPPQGCPHQRLKLARLPFRHYRLTTFIFKLNAEDRNRTGTELPPRDFKSLASASSATPAEYGAGDGNRTHVISLEGWSSTIELHPHI